MEQESINLEEIYRRLMHLENALKAKGIIEDDEGELTVEFKEELENRRHTPESEYISFEDVKKRVLKKK